LIIRKTAPAIPPKICSFLMLYLRGTRGTP
jgi:hypothetical protein